MFSTFLIGNFFCPYLLQIASQKVDNSFSEINADCTLSLIPWNLTIESPFPKRHYAPPSSIIVLESIYEFTTPVILVAKFAFNTPVKISTDGL